jgi:hypothetical protein
VPVELEGWGVVDAAGGRQELTGRSRPEPSSSFNSGTRFGSATSAIRCSARRWRRHGTVDQVSYKQRQVRQSRTICFGRDQWHGSPPEQFPFTGERADESAA